MRTPIALIVPLNVADADLYSVRHACCEPDPRVSALYTSAEDALEAINDHARVDHATRVPAPAA